MEQHKEAIHFSFDDTISDERAKAIAPDTTLNVNCPNVNEPNESWFETLYFPTSDQCSQPYKNQATDLLL